MTENSRQYEEVRLWTAEDRAAWWELEARLKVARTAAQGPRKAGAGSSVTAITEEMRTFHAEAEERSTAVRMYALKRSEWRAMKLAHPSRMEDVERVNEDGEKVTVQVVNDADAALGFNAESIADDLVPASARDGFSSAAARDEFLDDLSEPDFDLLYEGALKVNEGRFHLPKAQVMQQLDQMSAEISTSPDPSG